jgi:regulatory protein
MPSRRRPDPLYADPAIEGEALRLLASREHSRLELGRKLGARGYSEAAIRPVIDALSRRGLLSEERLAEAYVAERLRKGFGPLRVRQELHQKGLSDELIDPHLSLGDDQWRDRLAAVHNKKYGCTLASDPKERARRARFLEYRGFPAELIRHFLADD